MRNAVLRWALPLLAIALLGPLAAGLTSGITAPDGSTGATTLTSDDPAGAALRTLGALALAGVAGLITARLLSGRAGLGTAGLVLACAAWRSATLDDLVRQQPDHALLGRLALEGLLLALPAVLLAILITIAATDEREHAPGAPSEPVRARAARTLRALVGVGPIMAGAVGVVAGAVLAWLVAQEPLKGQCLAAAAIAGIAAGAAGRLIHQDAPAPLFVASLGVLAVLGPLSPLLMSPGADLLTALSTNRIFALALPVPADWLAGAFLGVPMGLSWADSMLEKRAPQTA